MTKPAPLLVAIALAVLAIFACGGEGESGATAPTQRVDSVPSIEDTLPDLWRFLGELDAGIDAGTTDSTEAVIARCRRFYTPERMAEIEASIPGWRHMASFADGKTLWHVNVAMLAILRLEEYRSMEPGERKVIEWTVLLHDIAKEPVEGRDHRHPFRSAAVAGRILPQLGFPVTPAYSSAFEAWFELTDTAFRHDADQDLELMDNAKLPAILAGIGRNFAEPTRTAVAAIALHQSITSLAAWPVKTPLTDEQVATYVDEEVRPVLAVLTLADSGGWNLFDPTILAAMQEETRAVFRDLPVGRSRLPSAR